MNLNWNRGRGLTILGALLLGACEPVNTSVSPGTQAEAQVLKPAEVKTPAEVLARFESDLKACASLIRVLESDRGFIDKFLPVQSRDVQPVSQLLRKSKVASSPEVAYFLSHEKYMRVDVNFHGDAWSVAWMEKEPIFCAPTFERLSEIEALGESGEGWRIRSFFLDKALENIDQPWFEADCGCVSFDRFKARVQEAEQLYRGTQKAAFHAWLEKAVKTLDESRKDVTEGAAGLTSKQQHQIMDERIGFLRILLPADLGKQPPTSS